MRSTKDLQPSKFPFDLLPDEQLQEIVFPPVSTSFDEKRVPIISLSELLHSHNLMAVLTSQRVLLLTEKSDRSLRLVEVLSHGISRSVPRATFPIPQMSTTDRLERTSLRAVNHLLSRGTKGNSSNASIPFASYRSSCIGDEIISIQFLGCALLMTGTSGCIRYLIPSFSKGRLVKFSPLSRLIQRALGERQVNSTQSLGTLVCLPRNLSPHYPLSHRVVSVFPDRLLVTYADRLPQFNSVRFHPSVFPSLTFRPINPFELLIASTILPAGFEPKANPSLTRRITDVCSQIIQLYAPVLPSDAHSSVNNRFARYVPSKHLLLVFSRSWFADLPSREMTLSTIPIFADLLISPTNRTETKTSETFPSGQSLPSGIRAFWRFASSSSLGMGPIDQNLSDLSRLTETTLEVLYDSAKPVLVDLLTTSETFGGAHLPLRGSALSKRISSFARLLVLQSKRRNMTLTEVDFIFILKLFDIAADFSSLFEWLRTCDNLASPSPASLMDIIREFSSEVQRLSKSDIRSILRYHSQELEESTEAAAKLKDFMQSDRLLSLPHITKAQRSKSLHSSLLDLIGHFKVKKQKDVSNQHPFLVDTVGLKKNCLTSFQKQGGIITGPSWSDLGTFPLKINALDLIEEFMATQQHFESVEGSSGFAGDYAHNEMGGGSSPFFELQPVLPVTWVENVGVGRELDKVSAYFRFSDVFLPNEHGFVCSAEPFSRLVFLDLSRYEGPGLELFYENTRHQFSIDSTQSNINSGDRHESTKSLCDVTHIVDQSPEDSSESGLRVLVSRGSPLDVGCYHRSPQRSKLTLEMHVAFQHPQNSRKTGKLIVLCERRASPSLSLWRLEVSENGALRFSMGSNWISSEKTGFNLFTHLERRSNELREGREDEEEDEGATSSRLEFSPFVHLALILDSTVSTCDCRSSGDDFLLVHSNPIRVILYVDGEKVIENQVEIRPQQIQETQLARTHLFFLPNASVNYRLTELRVWSDLRSMQEIIDQRENYLLLAEKRCRLQMQLKGTRKLFSAFRDIVIGPPCSNLIEPLSASATETSNPKNTTSAHNTRFSLALPTATTGIVTPSSTETGAAGGVIPPASTTSTTMTARQKRLSVLKDGGNSLKPHSAPLDVGHMRQAPIAPPEFPLKQNSASITTNIATSFEPSFPAFNEPPPPPPVKPPPLPPVENTEETPLASIKPFTLGDSREVGTVGSNGLSNGLNYSEDLSAVCSRWATSSFLRNIQKRRTRFLTIPTLLGFLSNELSIEIIYSVLGESPRHSNSLKLHSKSITIPSDLSLTGSNQDYVLAFSYNSKTLHNQIAICGNKSLDVVEISSPLTLPSPTISRVVSLPLISTPLVYFFYLTPELMVLITPSEGFTWKPALRDDGSGKSRYDPIRILHRVDLLDLKSWQERSVLDVSVSAERWTMVTSCGSQLSGKDDDLRSHVVSIHHAKSGKALSFRAVAGAFRTPGQLILLFYLEATKEWKLALFDLQHLLEVASSGVESPRHSKEASNLHHLTPFEFTDIVFATVVDVSSVASNNHPNATSSAPVLTGLWSISLPTLFADPSATTGGFNSLVIPLLAAAVYQINDKVFVLSSSGVIALVDAGSLKCCGRLALFPENDEKIVSTTSDFSNLENPVVICLVWSKRANVSRLLTLELKPLAKTIKSDLKALEK